MTIPDYVAELESQNSDLPVKVTHLTAERDCLQSEVALLKDKEVSSKLEAAAAHSEVCLYTGLLNQPQGPFIKYFLNCYQQYKINNTKL